MVVDSSAPQFKTITDINKKINRRSYQQVETLETLVKDKNLTIIDWEQGISARELKLGKLAIVKEFKPGEKYQGRVLDPLGNVFLDYTTDFTSVGRTLSQRVKELASYSRMGSKSIGELKEVPEENKFFETIRHYGERFHELVHSHPQAANRFFGNASFRCEKGFPSFRQDDLIYVSQRNIDKRFVDKESFVPVSLKLPLEYYGDKKPSVDTPIQVLLYQYFENVRYMLHGHVYVKNAPFTKEIIPCGALEEAEEIIKIFPSRQDNNFAINLKGHGSLVLVDKVEKLENIPYIARPQPETYENHFSRK